MSEALKIEGLQKTYENGFEALKGIDLSVEPGDFFALLGPNGAGKSTTIGIVSSLVAKTAGKVWVHGVDIDNDFPGAKRHLGIVPQEFNFNVFEKVEDILTNQAGYYGIPLREASRRTDEFLERLGLTEKRHTRARMLSGGMKRRLMIARALVHQPRLLILDEPTSGVDVSGQAALYNLVKDIRDELKCGVLLVSHNLHIVMAATDRVVCLNRHLCCSGTPEDVRNHPEFMNLFGGESQSIGIYRHHHDHDHDIHGDIHHH